MPRKLIEFTVFVASPSDVEDEVAHLATVIEHLNSEWESKAIRFRLVTWQSHVDPAFGDDPQAVINQQIPSDYDIFIGILWSRMGKPTARAESGTIEEFRRAKKRHDEDPESVTLMFYFKESPVPLSQIDPDQIRAVQDFRGRLGEEGGLYKKFETVTEFENIVRLNMARYLHNKTGNSAAVSELAGANDILDYQTSRPVPDDERGLSDLQETFDAEFTALATAFDDINATKKKLFTLIERRTEDLEKATQRADISVVGHKVLRDVNEHIAAGMDEYVAEMKSILPRFTSHLDRGIAAFVAALPLHAQISNWNASDRATLKETVSSLRGDLQRATASTEEVRTTIGDIPSITRAMNRARRAIDQILHREIDAMRRADLQLAEVESLIGDWIARED